MVFQFYDAWYVSGFFTETMPPNRYVSVYTSIPGSGHHCVEWYKIAAGDFN